MNRRNLFILLAMMSFVSLKAQQFSTSMPVKINGYIIALDGAILFQPADSTVTLWESLDNRSFAIWCNPFDDFYCEAIAGIGKEVTISYTTQKFLNPYKSTLRYFYGTIEVLMPFLSADTNDFQVSKSSYYTLNHNGKNYPLEGFISGTGC